MRTTAIAALAATILTLVMPLQAAEMTSSVQEPGNVNPYAAGACAAPGYGALGIQSGCCENQSCCYNVWAGYCQEKRQGFAFPSIRPAVRACAPVPENCRECSVHQQAPLPSQPPVPPLQSPKKAKSAPMPALQLPPPPAVPQKPQTEKPNKAESKSPSDSADASLPLFNPAGWKIGQPLR